MKYKVWLSIPETFEIEADSKGEAELRVLEGLGSDEERGLANIEVKEI